MVVPSLPAMTNTETVDEIADWLAENLAALGLEPVADELTESCGGDVPPPLHRLRLAAALSGVCDRMMWDAINEAGAAAYDAGALEAAARQRAHSFDPVGQLGANHLHGVHFGLFLQQRVVSAGAFDDPTDPNPTVTDPLLFTAGLALNVAIGVIRFGMAYADGDMLRLANQAGGTFTILNELKRLCGYVLAPPEVHAERGTDPRMPPPAGAWDSPTKESRPAPVTATKSPGAPAARPEDLLNSAGRTPAGEDCQQCAFSAASGGILCGCGHDWGCHSGSAGQEPCTHCGCPNMQTS